ncbi:MAG: hypothetical protein K6D94_09535 [Clostridiales bacterium]|nr:hypothetical protein [Clostridiales bacterium]
MKTKKLTAIFAAAVLLCSLALSCCGGAPADKAEDKPSAAAAQTDAAGDPEDTENEASKKLTDGLPDTDLGGWEMRIIAHHDGLSDERTIYSQEMNGEVINDIIYQRNHALEDRFNFKYTVYPADGWNDCYVKLKNSVMAGSRDYDMIFILPFSTSGACVRDKILYNMNSVPYLNFSQPWWHTNINDLYTYRNYLPFVSSDYLLSSYQYSNILIFNKVMANNYQLEDIYSLIRGGTWTIDKFGKMCEAVTADINGDGVFDVNDQYGIATNYGYHAITWGYAIGDMSVKLTDGTVELGYANEKFYSLCEWLYNLLYVSHQAFEIGWDLESEIKWDENHLLFEAMWLADLEKFRDVTVDYGVIPYPKYDEAQDMYHTYTDARSGAVAIPMDAPKDVISNVGLVVEALSCASYNDLIPAYISSVTETKYSRDEESIEMMDYIAKGRVWDVGYTMTGTDSYTWAIYRWLKNSDGAIASSLEKNSAKMIKSFDKVIEAYQELADMDWPGV